MTAAEEQESTVHTRTAVVASRVGLHARPAALFARAAAATGLVDGFFFETHPDPDSSPSDAANMIFLKDFSEVLKGVHRAHAAANQA